MNLRDLLAIARYFAESGYSATLINYGEEHLSRGVEIVVGGDIFKQKDFTWSSSVNWAADRYYYHKVDEQYSTQYPWVAPGENWHWIADYDYERDPEGNIINYAGKHLLYGKSDGLWLVPSGFAGD
jgi:hypothetical protein